MYKLLIKTLLGHISTYATNYTHVILLHKVLFAQHQDKILHTSVITIMLRYILITLLITLTLEVDPWWEQTLVKLRMSPVNPRPINI